LLHIDLYGIPNLDIKGDESKLMPICSAFMHLKQMGKILLFVIVLNSEHPL
jgi:hypothetical protein